MKYYIVSEAELEHALDLMYESGVSGGICSSVDELQDAVKICKSRLVPDWATHVTGNKLNGRQPVTEWNFVEINR